jgi:hypothetical protein
MLFSMMSMRQSWDLIILPTVSCIEFVEEYKAVSLVEVTLEGYEEDEEDEEKLQQIEVKELARRTVHPLLVVWGNIT